MKDTALRGEVDPTHFFEGMVLIIMFLGNWKGGSHDSGLKRRLDVSRVWELQSIQLTCCLLFMETLLVSSKPEAILVVSTFADLLSPRIFLSDVRKRMLPLIALNFE